jgi:hypothetical protein
MLNKTQFQAKLGIIRLSLYDVHARALCPAFSVPPLLNTCQYPNDTYSTLSTLRYCTSISLMCDIPPLSIIIIIIIITTMQPHKTLACRRSPHTCLQNAKAADVS